MSIAISIIIVHYRTPKALQACIGSVMAHTSGIGSEIIVVDNHSEDDAATTILQQYENVRWFNMPCNSGFARANNYGVAQAKGQYVLLLNPDTYFTENTIYETLHEYRRLEQEGRRVGMLGCMVALPDGTLQNTTHTSFPGIKILIKANPLFILLSRIFKPKPIATGDTFIPRTFSAPNMGMPYALFNKTLFTDRQLYLDEDYFLYYEDTDWCKRAVNAGFTNYCHAAAKIFHTDGGSSNDNDMRRKQIFVSGLLFIYKAYGGVYYLAYTGLLLFNFALDEVLYLKTCLFSGISDGDEQEKKVRCTKAKLIWKYGLFILLNYSRKPNSNSVFLKAG